MTAGELADHFPFSKPTMSAHFSVLREAGLVGATKSGKSVVYDLRLSVLEDALLGFAALFKFGAHEKAIPSKPTSEAADPPTADGAVVRRK